jgi:hypothetical protein
MQPNIPERKKVRTKYDKKITTGLPRDLVIIFKVINWNSPLSLVICIIMKSPTIKKMVLKSMNPKAAVKSNNPEIYPTAITDMAPNSAAMAFENFCTMRRILTAIRMAMNTQIIKIPPATKFDF